MKLHNVSHKRSLSQSVSAFSCISFTLMTIDVSCSSRIEKLPSSYSSESAEWKVLHEKKKKKKKKKMANLLLLHLVNFTEFRPFYVRYYSVSSRGICQNCIVGIGLFTLSRSRPFFASCGCLRHRNVGGHSVRTLHEWSTTLRNGLARILAWSDGTITGLC